MAVDIACNYLHPSQTLFSSSPCFPSPTPLFSCIKAARTGKSSPKLSLSKKTSFHEPSSKRSAFNHSSDAVFNNNNNNEEEEELIKKFQDLSPGFQEDSSNVEAAMASSFALPEPPKWVKSDEPTTPNSDTNAPQPLRIIQGKKSFNKVALKEASESAYSSIKKAFSSMLFILRELQSYTLQMRELIYYENLHGVAERVHGELNASFVWLFQQIFSCTPIFMLSVMLLLANFTVHSIGTGTALASVSMASPALVDRQKDHELATIQDGKYGSYQKTEVMYYKLLSEDPKSAMILSNLAQFFYVVHHDHTRAEFYFKKAVDIEPRDAEAANQYAIFLWKAKNDLEGAEERYLEAIAAEPGNSYYAANYAHFLWNTGGEETCYPLDGSL